MPSVLSADRVAVIGDVGGHLDELQRELLRLGADSATGRLPKGLVVVQVGDLIHRGPDSAGVISLVDAYLRTQPDQWLQLVGNHEAQYLRAPAFEWPERLPGEAIAHLRHWWAEGQMVAAVSIGSASERLLITHAGLTSGFWRRVLGGIGDPAQAAAALNSFIGTHEDVLFNAGQMLGGGKPDQLAGPIWATAATELVPSWLGVPMPFSQIHGHTTILGRSKPDGRARVFDRVGRSAKRLSAAEVLSADIASRTVLDAEPGHEITTLDGGRIIGIDPGHTRQARPSWRAWELAEPGELHC